MSPPVTPGAHGVTCWNARPRPGRSEAREEKAPEELPGDGHEGRRGRDAPRPGTHQGKLQPRHDSRREHRDRPLSAGAPSRKCGPPTEGAPCRPAREMDLVISSPGLAGTSERNTTRHTGGRPPRGRNSEYPVDRNAERPPEDRRALSAMWCSVVRPWRVPPFADDAITAQAPILPLGPTRASKRAGQCSCFSRMTVPSSFRSRTPLRLPMPSQRRTICS